MQVKVTEKGAGDLKVGEIITLKSDNVPAWLVNKCQVTKRVEDGDNQGATAPKKSQRKSGNKP